MKRRLKRSTVSSTILGTGGRKNRKVTVPLTVEKTAEAEGPDSTSSAPDDFQYLTGNEPAASSSFRSANAFYNWSNLRPKMMKVFIESQAIPESAICIECQSTAACARCVECGPNQYFCWKCASKIHKNRNQFHVLELWQDSKFIPLYPDHEIIGYGHTCPTQIRKPMTFIDYHGRQHAKQVEVCNCESIAETLLRLNYWPGSPDKPTVAFDMRLMQLCEKFFCIAKCLCSIFQRC